MKTFIMILVTVIVSTVFAYYTAQYFNSRDQNILDESRGTIVMDKLPHAYMIIVVNKDTLFDYDRTLFKDAKAKWCREGHEGNQVIVVNKKGNVHFLTFEELKLIGK